MTSPQSSDWTIWARSSADRAVLACTVARAACQAVLDLDPSGAVPCPWPGAATLERCKEWARRYLS